MRVVCARASAADIAPAHYRAFRAFMLRHAALFDAEAEADAASDEWDALYASSYRMLGQASTEWGWGAGRKSVGTRPHCCAAPHT
eukprot:7106102-Prymnesium_polylepis.2